LSKVQQQTTINLAPPRFPHATSLKRRQSVLERVLLSDGPVFYSCQTCPVLFRTPRVVLDKTPLTTSFEWFFLCLDEHTARRSTVEIRGGGLDEGKTALRTILSGVDLLTSVARPLRLEPLWDEIRAIGGIEVTVRDDDGVTLPGGLLTAVAFNYVKPVTGERA
jgi:hypothetical protein